MVVPKISVVRGKCAHPLDCKACVRACPQAVFKLKPFKFYKFRETPSEDYEVVPVYLPACTGCNLCVELCPAGAIEINYEEIPWEEGGEKFGAGLSGV